MEATRERPRYRELGRLGTGGMGTVTLAEDRVLRRRVALKRVQAADDPRELSRLRREALVGASLNHRNLVAVYDVQEANDGELVIVMEYVEGETLRQAIRRRGAFPTEQALRVLRGLADALDALHSRGIVHRDVKPENILLGDEAIKLADLGIARTAEQTQTTAGSGAPGTFSYMAPEQLEGRNTGPAIDIYAFAAVAFEILSGRKARREPNPVALAHAIATGPPPDLREVWPASPAEVAALLSSAMSRDPAARPRSARMLVGRLADALSPRARPEPPSPSGPRRGAAPFPPLDARHPGPRVSRTPRAAAARVPSSGRSTAASRPRSSASGRGRTPTQVAPARDRVLSPVRADSSRRRNRLIAGLGLLCAIGVLAAVVGSSGSSGPTRVPSVSAKRKASGTTASHSRHSTHHPARTEAAAAAQFRSDEGEATSPPADSTGAAAAGGSTSSEQSAPPAAPAAPAAEAGSPSTAVESFYEAAARHDYSAAWQLADGNMRSQLAGFDSFRAQQSEVRSIAFHRAQVISGSGGSAATVAVQTTAVLADRTEQCSGTVRLLRSPPAAWLLDRISINCVP